MKKICTIVLLTLSFANIAYADEVKFVWTKKSWVKQATLDDYQKALFRKSQKTREEQIRDDIINHFRKGKDEEEVHDYSYRYKKKSEQLRALSCEISVASDILARHTGRQISEDYLLEKIEKSAYNQLPKKVDGKLIWWNPNLWFVGNIDRLKNGVKASQWNMTGYWVLERPIAKLYEDYGFETRIITEKSHIASFDKNDHLTLLLESLEDGDSVQLWWDYCTTPEFEDTKKKNKCASLNKQRKISWYYKDINGDLVKHEWLAGEHAFFLLGYTWSKHSPKKIIVWDSRTGKHSYKTEEWMRKWERMQYRSIIVYDDKK